MSDGAKATPNGVFGPGTRDGPPPSPLPVLVAEDDPANRRLLQIYLERWGYEPVLAANGDMAWGLLQKEDAPQMAILDWMMPGMDGLELCRRLRGGPRPRFFYIILLTARESREDLLAGLQAGANDYVTKPFDAVELRARVETGVRLLQLQASVEEHARALEAERQQTRAYRALVMERERFDAAVHAMSDGIVVTDGQWRLSTVNHAACRLLNIPEDGWEGMDLKQVLEPFSLSVPWDALRMGEDRVTKLEVARPQTRPPLFLDARLTRVQDGGGELASTVLTVRAVTEEKLEQRARADFLMLVSHKLLTPLTVLSGFFQLWRRWDKTRVMERWAEMVEIGSDRLRELEVTVRKLLEFKTLTTQQLEAAAQQTDLADAIAACSRKFQELHPPEKLRITVEIDPTASLVFTDASHVGFMLSKIIDNAIKFNDKPQSVVDVRAVRNSDCWVEVTVTDNGPGLPHEYLDRVFDGFVQVEDVVTGQVPGLGVGLYLAKRVVEAYGGRIRMESRLGQGCVVGFTLPARLMDHVSTEPTAMPRRQGSLPQSVATDPPRRLQ